MKTVLPTNQIPGDLNSDPLARAVAFSAQPHDKSLGRGGGAGSLTLFPQIPEAETGSSLLGSKPAGYSMPQLDTLDYPGLGPRQGLLLSAGLSLDRTE